MRQRDAFWNVGLRLLEGFCKTFKLISSAVRPSYPSKLNRAIETKGTQYKLTFLVLTLRAGSRSGGCVEQWNDANISRRSANSKAMCLGICDQFELMPLLVHDFRIDGSRRKRYERSMRAIRSSFCTQSDARAIRTLTEKQRASNCAISLNKRGMQIKWRYYD